MSTPTTFVNEWTIDSLARVAGLPGPFTSRLRRLVSRGYGVRYVASDGRIHFVAGRDSVGRTVKISQVRPHPVAAIVGPRTRSNPDGIRFIGGEKEWVTRDLDWYRLNDSWSDAPRFSYKVDWFQELVARRNILRKPVDDETGAGDSNK